MEKELLIVYTDGSCFKNGRSNATGGIGIHFPNHELDDVSKIFDKSPITNQRAELYAILYTIRYIKKNIGLKKYCVLIKTDSEYSINCITKWVSNWKRNGWKTKDGRDVQNRELIEKIHEYVSRYDIEFEHVRSHTGDDDEDAIGNDKADKLAVAAHRKVLVKKEGGSKSNRGRKERITKNIYPIEYDMDERTILTKKNCIIELVPHINRKK